MNGTEWIPPYLEPGKEVLFKGKPKKVMNITWVPDPEWQELDPGRQMMEIEFHDGTIVRSLIDISDPNPKRRGGKRV